MQKIAKRGFRGERKGIGTRGHMTEKGECGDGKSEGDVVKTSRWLSSKGGV